MSTHRSVRPPRRCRRRHRRAWLGDEGTLAGFAHQGNIAPGKTQGGAGEIRDDRQREPQQVAHPGPGDDGTSAENRALHDRRAQIAVTGSSGQDMAGAEGGAPQRDPVGIQFGAGAGEGQRRVDVLGVAALTDQLPRFAAGFAEVAEVEGHHGQSRLCEPSFVLPEHHLVGGAAAVDENDGRVWARIVGQCQPGRAAVAAGREISADRHGTSV